MKTYTISGNIIDLFNRHTFPGEITVSNGCIASIKEIDKAPDQYILPGLVDAHIHIESSMLTPTAFAQMAVVHGTVATVSDPHEIANVCGIDGVRYMIDNSKKTPFKFFFGAPSCVPATTFETAGATLDSKAVGQLLLDPDIWYLSEMMNYPGVLHNDPEVMAKIAAAKYANKPIDGHAPGMRGKDVITYAAAGITTDHECFTLAEALDKVNQGMRILIREGSAAKNYEALADLLRTHPHMVMFCSDDKHPDELELHHINMMVKRSLQKGYDLYDVLHAATLNPVLHYRLPVGLLREGDSADFIVVNNLTDFNILQTHIGGRLVAENGKSLLPFFDAKPINNFKAEPRTEADFRIPASKPSPVIKVIEALEGQLITNMLQLQGKVENGNLVSDIDRDILKLVVINRYEPNACIATAFIKNFGLKQGALASTVAHDCHNIIAVATDDASMCAAVNALVACKGGITVAKNKDEVETLPLPVAGLMALDNGYDVAAAYKRLNAVAGELGTPLHAPFMTLSFMALLVIPSLKLSDLGLFDGSSFAFADLQA